MKFGKPKFWKQGKERTFGWKARIEGVIFTNEPVKNEKSRRESPKGNNNNSNAVDVHVQRSSESNRFFNALFFFFYALFFSIVLNLRRFSLSFGNSRFRAPRKLFSTNRRT